MENQRLNAVDLKNTLLYTVPSNTIREVLADIDQLGEVNGTCSAKSLRTELFKESGMKGVILEVLKVLALYAVLFALSLIVKDKNLSFRSLYASVVIILSYLILTKDYLLIGRSTPEKNDIPLFVMMETAAFAIGLIMVTLPFVDLMTWRLIQLFAAVSCLGILTALFFYIGKRKIWIAGAMIHFIINAICGGVLYMDELSHTCVVYYFGSIYPAEILATVFSIVWLIIFFKKGPKAR